MVYAPLFKDNDNECCCSITYKKLPLYYNKLFIKCRLAYLKDTEFTLTVNGMIAPLIEIKHLTA